MPHLSGPLLVHHAGHRLSEETNSLPGRHHDHAGLDLVCGHLHPPAPRLEGGEAGGGVPQVLGESLNPLIIILFTNKGTKYLHRSAL